MRKVWILLLGLLLATCSGGGETAVPKPGQITCTAAYRSSVEIGIEQEETRTFTDADADAEQSAAFADMTFHAAFRTGAADNERNLQVWVTDAADTVSHSTLYQLPIDSGPQNQFVGGHGFTGLNYNYSPDSDAELQYWCAAN